MDQTTRRRFVTGIGAAAAALGAPAAAVAQTSARPRFQAARYPQDDWLDKIPGKHRIIIDAVTPNGAGEAVLFANNLYVADKKGYNLGDSDLAIVICMRHFATPFAFDDAFWAKHGKMVGGMLKFNDPKTQQPPATNVYNSDYGMDLPNLGSKLGDVIAKGTHLAICQMATEFFAEQAAKANGSTTDAMVKEFTARALPNSHFVAAGVVGINRAQEHGYTLIYAG